jgi:hypothetical protein
MFKKISLFFVLALLMSSFFVKPVEARAFPVRVPANVEWIDTGIDVVAVETFSFKAKGQAITGPLNEYPDAKSGPGGQVTTCYDGAVPGEICVLDGVPFGALIGKIGVGGVPFLIGDSVDFTAGATGRLYLAVNDFSGTYDDNQAGFTVIFK